MNGARSNGQSFLGAPDRYRSLAEVLREQGFKPGDSIRFNHWQTFEEAAFAQRARLSQYWLVRNDGSSGERLRCQNHGMSLVSEPIYHAYMTLCCVNRPFLGLGNALYAYFKTHSETETGQDKHRLLKGMPGMGSRHPETAAVMQPVAPGETLWSVVLGLPEPISARRAQGYLEEINLRIPDDPLVL